VRVLLGNTKDEAVITCSFTGRCRNFSSLVVLLSGRRFVRNHWLRHDCSRRSGSGTLVGPGRRSHRAEASTKGDTHATLDEAASGQGSQKRKSSRLMGTGNGSDEESLARRLVSAVSDHSVDLVCAAIRDGAEIDHEDPDTGQTALERAIDFADRDVVRLLLQHGADSNRVGREGRRPLHLAVGASIDNAVAGYDAGARDERADTGCIGELLAVGADPELGDEWGETSLDLARRLGHDDAISLLEAVQRRRF